MSLRTAIKNISSGEKCWLWSTENSLEVTQFLKQSCLNENRDALSGKSVLILTDDQLTTAAILLELDGFASRLLACHPDIQRDDLAKIVAQARIDAVVTTAEQSLMGTTADNKVVVRVQPPAPFEPSFSREFETEWLLLTSGTTGGPKIVSHTFRSLTGAIRPNEWGGELPVWSTFYDIRRYGGLQIFLRAMTCGASMVLSDSKESMPSFLTRLSDHGVTHMSGTPSHWRRALMNPNIDALDLSYVRLSGEIADQATLDRLSAAFPGAAIGHAYASTEAGVAFAVNDKLEGFPQSVIGKSDLGVAIKVVDGTLRIKSSLVAAGYVGDRMPRLKDQDGFVDSGDIVERRGDRYYFVGRRNGVINVGGWKVHPEEVESVISRHPAVQMSLVSARKNPVTGSIVVADVVVKAGDTAFKREQLRSEILKECRQRLPQYKVPAVIRFVKMIDIAKSGKLGRTNA